MLTNSMYKPTGVYNELSIMMNNLLLSLRDVN